MRQIYRNSLLVVAIGMGVVSLPNLWLTLHDVNMRESNLPPEVVEAFGATFSSVSIDVTGLSRFLVFPLKIPIWSLILVSMTACLAQVLDSSRMFGVPMAFQIGLAVGAALWTIPLWMAVISMKATPGIGLFLGAFCSFTPAVMLCLRNGEPEQEPEELLK